MKHIEILFLLITSQFSLFVSGYESNPDNYNLIFYKVEYYSQEDIIPINASIFGNPNSSFVIDDLRVNLTNSTLRSRFPMYGCSLCPDWGFPVKIVKENNFVWNPDSSDWSTFLQLRKNMSEIVDSSYDQSQNIYKETRSDISGALIHFSVSTSTGVSQSITIERANRLYIDKSYSSFDFDVTFTLLDYDPVERNYSLLSQGQEEYARKKLIDTLIVLVIALFVILGILLLLRKVRK